MPWNKVPEQCATAGRAQADERATSADGLLSKAH
jgi:hypothetical protein